MGAKDTVNLMLQTKGGIRGETLTSMIPLSWEAFEAIVSIGVKILEGRKAKEAEE